MEYDQNIQYLSMAFWQIIMTAGPILVVALSVGLFIGLIQWYSFQCIKTVSQNKYLWSFYIIISFVIKKSTLVFIKSFLKFDKLYFYN